MLSHNQTKLLAALQVKKYRQKYRKFIVEGEKMTAELLTQSRFQVETLYGTERWWEENAALAAPYSAGFVPVTEADLKKVSALATPQGVLAVVAMPEEAANPSMALTDLCFYLDGIRDPGNLGTILRVADWFGFPAVFCSPDSADVYHPKVVQASMGAFLRVNSREIALDELLRTVPGLPLIGAVMDGSSLFESRWPVQGLVVIGNEGQGISPAVQQILTHRLTIPRDPAGGAESLNASVAAGIIAAVLKNTH